MSSNMESSAVLAHLTLPETAQTRDVVTASGMIPASLKDVSILNDQWVLGTKPSDFVKEYSSVEINLNELTSTFKNYCKDFDEPLIGDVPSKALEFSAKILFEFGPLMRGERKGKGDKAIRFRFPYKKETIPKVDDLVLASSTPHTLSVKTVIVSTFKDHQHESIETDNKMVLSMKQATVLAMVTFSKVAMYAYSSSDSILLTPLCGAIFSKASVLEIASQCQKSTEDMILILNESTSPNGHLLPNSNMACAIVASIAGTKGMTNRGGRDQIIGKVIKQYSSKNKEYDSNDFNIFAEHALGGVPPGLDSNTLIENFKNVQAAARIRNEKKSKDIPRGPGGSEGRGGTGGTSGAGSTDAGVGTDRTGGVGGAGVAGKHPPPKSSGRGASNITTSK